jgi:hypothetical protein
MNVGDTLRVLALAAQYDATLLPADEQEQATKAAAWNHALDTRIEVGWALTTVAAIYAEQAGVRLLPANLNTRFLARSRGRYARCRVGNFAQARRIRRASRRCSRPLSCPVWVRGSVRFSGQR